MAYINVERPDTTPLATLTNPEQVLVAHVANGMSNRQVAEPMFISRHTVYAHLRRSSATSPSTRALVSRT